MSLTVYSQLNIWWGDGDAWEEHETSFVEGDEFYGIAGRLYHCITNIKSLPGHWSWAQCLTNYVEEQPEYPGEQIGLSKEDYEWFVALTDVEGDDYKFSGYIRECIEELIRGRNWNGYCLTVYGKDCVKIRYYDENEDEHVVSVIEEKEEE